MEIFGQVFGDEIQKKENLPYRWLTNEQRWLLKFDQCELLAVVDVARDLRVDFLKLAPSRDFETSSRAVKNL